MSNQRFQGWPSPNIGTPGTPGTNIDHNQQQYSYNNGSTQIHVQQHHYSSTTHTQGAGQLQPLVSPGIIAPQIQHQQPLQTIAPPHSANDIHSQMAANAAAHHQAAIQSHNAVTQGIQNQFNSMLHQQPVVQALPPPTPYPQAVYQQQFSPYQLPGPQSPQAHAYPAYGHTLQIAAGPQAESSSEEESESEEGSDDSNDGRVLALQQQQAARENQHRADIEAKSRESEALTKRLRDLEHQRENSSRERVKHDREKEDLRKQIAFRDQQRLQDAQKHKQEMADLVRLQASSPSVEAPAFDMEALKRAIRESQGHHVTPEQMAGMLQETVRKNIQGVARTEDLVAAGNRMANVMNEHRASDSERRQVAIEECGKVMQKIARHMSEPQSSIEAPLRQHDTPWQESRFQTQYAIEEIPDSEQDRQRKALQGSYSRVVKALPAASSHGSSSSAPYDQNIRQADSGKHTALNLEQPHIPTQEEQSGTPLTAGVLALLPGPKKSSSKSRMSSSKHPASAVASPDNMLVRSKKSKKSTMSVNPSPENAMIISRSYTPPPASIAPASENAVAKVKRSKKSTVSVQPSASNAIFRTPDLTGGQRSAAQAMAEHQSGQLQRSDFSGHRAYENVPDDFPDTASQITSWQRQKDLRDLDTISTLKPRNDRRVEHGLDTVAEAPEQADEPGNMLVKQSKSLAKKASRR